MHVQISLQWWVTSCKFLLLFSYLLICLFLIRVAQYLHHHKSPWSSLASWRTQTGAASTTNFSSRLASQSCALKSEGKVSNICHIFPVGRIFSWQDVVCFEHWEDGIELIQEITFTPGGLQVSQSSLNQTSVIKATILDYCTALFISTSIYYFSLCVTVCISAHQGCINLTS